MKRIISLLTVLAMLVATFAMLAMPATAATAEPSLDDKLLSWWNFEGETDAEKLADKVKDGTKESLEPTAVTFANNAAEISASGVSCLQIPNAGDFASLDGKTFYIAYKATGTSTGNSHLFAASGNGVRYWLPKDASETSYNFAGSVRDTGTKFGNGTNRTLKNWADDIPTAIANGSDWYYTVFTFKLGDGTFTIEIYNSADGTNYSHSAQTEPNWVGNLTVDRATVIGRYTKTTTGTGMGFVVDDMRIYDGILTAAEISSLATNRPYKDYVEEPDVVPAPGMFDENLVAYYDFEGETKAEQFADKAPYGSSKDDLFATENVSATNGVASVPSTAEEYISLESTTGDLADLVGKTIYVKFKAVGTATSGVDVISATNTFRYWLAGGTTAENYKFGGGIGSAPTKAGSSLGTITGPAKPAGDWYYVAITIEDNGSNLVVKVYNSDDGSTYVNNTAKFDSGSMLARTTSLLFGKATKTVADRGLSYDFNEIRIYDTVLTAKQVKALSAVDAADYTSVLGWQEKINADTDLLDVRVVGHINLSEEALKKFSKVGFEITAEYAGGTKPAKTMESDAVYTSVIAGDETITPASYELAGGYLFVLPIYNVPVEGTVIFTVRPYCVIGGETVYGATSTATYTNGVIVK